MGYLHCCRHLSAWGLGSWQLWSSKKDDHSYACGYFNNVCYQQCNANTIEHHVAKEQGDVLFFDLWTGQIASPQKEFTVFHYLLDSCTCPEVLIKYVVYSHLKFKCMCPLPCPLPPLTKCALQGFQWMEDPDVSGSNWNGKHSHLPWGTMNTKHTSSQARR